MFCLRGDAFHGRTPAKCKEPLNALNQKAKHSLFRDSDLSDTQRQAQLLQQCCFNNVEVLKIIIRLFQLGYPERGILRSDINLKHGFVVKKLALDLIIRLLTKRDIRLGVILDIRAEIGYLVGHAVQPET